MRLKGKKLLRRIERDLVNAETLLLADKNKQAEKYAREVLKLKSEHPKARYILGVVLMREKNYEQSLSLFEELSDRLDDVPAYHSSLGKLYSETARYDEAVASYEKALLLDDEYLDARKGLADLYQSVGKWDEALPLFYRIAYDCNRAELWIALGDIYRKQSHYDKAIDVYVRARDLEGGSSGIEFSIATIYYEQKKWSECLEQLKPLIESKAKDRPELWIPIVSAFHDVKLQLSDWDDLNKYNNILLDNVASGGSVPTFRFMQVDGISQRLMKVCSENFAKSLTEQAREFKINNNVEHVVRLGLPLRVAMVSPDFRNHVVLIQLIRVLELIDKNRISLHAYSLKKAAKKSNLLNRMLRIEGLEFYDVQNWSDDEVAEHMREKGIDIALDLAGYTAFNRAKVFAYQPAPVCVNWLGYPGTMGSDLYDWILADPHIIPEEAESGYTEKVWRLPDTYMPIDTTQAAAQGLSRVRCGLPETGFIFGGYNNNYKVSPLVFNAWCVILHRVPGSCLLLKRTSEEGINNLRKAAEQYNIDPERLIFGKNMQLETEHLARLEYIDLALDTWPYNMHASSADLMWVGVPLITLTGDTFAGRVAESIVRAAGFPELVMETVEEYIDTAVELATSPEKLFVLRERLRAAREQAPLFDCEKMARSLEDALIGMYETTMGGQLNAVESEAIMQGVHRCCPICENGRVNLIKDVDISCQEVLVPGVSTNKQWLHCLECDHVFSKQYLTTAGKDALLQQRQLLSSQAIRESLNRKNNVQVMNCILAMGRQPWDKAVTWLTLNFGESGLNLLAADYGYLAAGIDDRQEFIDAVKSLNYSVQRAGLKQLDGSQKVDVLSWRNGLAWSNFPREVLTKLSLLLNPGGLLVLELPMRGVYQWGVSVESDDEHSCWHDLYVQHWFSRKLLITLLEDAGFEIRHLESKPDTIEMLVVARMKHT